MRKSIGNFITFEGKEQRGKKSRRNLQIALDKKGEMNIIKIRCV